MSLVSFKPKPVSKRKGQGGQMAIFVALIFQVLFVFFAMAINIGLVVHDKINLQNSADLAAYYAAQKQAQWLNVIAHQNYQIRQSYKLMAWRYRVLGNMGVEEHPAFQNIAGQDVQAPRVSLPVVCAAYRDEWAEIGGNDNLCKEFYSDVDSATIIETIDAPPQVNFFNPLETFLQRMVTRVNTAIIDRCEKYGGFNYLFTNLLKFNYRMDQYRLKQVILKEAQNLAKPAEEMLDLNGDPVLEGVFKTVRKNLTFANRSSLQEIKVFNSIEGVDPSAWLNELTVNMNFKYIDVTSSNGDCKSQPKNASEPPNDVNGGAGSQAIQALSGLTKEQLFEFFKDPGVDSLYRMSVGFEKNPWMKLYVGVRVRTQPRQVFFPFGEPVQFEAIAYATPFGGRVGPWYKNFWPRGASESDGNSIDAQIVPLVSDSSGSITDDIKEAFLPNYSRYPGDPLGLKSALALSGIRDVKGGFQANLFHYGGSLQVGAGQVYDPLIWNESMANTPLRKFEIAAAAPDLFDISYYSIEPNYGKTYYPKLKENAIKFGFTGDAIPRMDLGAREDVDELNGFSVQDQMALAGAISIEPSGGLASANLHRPEAYYFIKNRAHLLTSWVHNNTFGSVLEENEFPEERFGRCEVFDDEYNHQIPGSCLFNGGRTGFSVKIISGSHLRSENLEYGGANQTGSILNPPPQPDSW